MDTILFIFYLFSQKLVPEAAIHVDNIEGWNMLKNWQDLVLSARCLFVSQPPHHSKLWYDTQRWIYTLQNKEGNLNVLFPK